MVSSPGRLAVADNGRVVPFRFADAVSTKVDICNNAAPETGELQESLLSLSAAPGKGSGRVGGKALATAAVCDRERP